jgi:hypothetical protein
MSWFKNLFSDSVGSVIDSVGNTIDKVVTSDEERGKLKNELETIRSQKELELQSLANDYEKEVTKRWVSDNKNVVASLVRPLSIVYMLVIFSIAMLFDGNVGEFQINEAYLPLIETFLTTMIVAYFGSRGIEKIKGMTK